MKKAKFTQLVVTAAVLGGSVIAAPGIAGADRPSEDNGTTYSGWILGVVCQEGQPSGFTVPFTCTLPDGSTMDCTPNPLYGTDRWDCVKNAPTPGNTLPTAPSSGSNTIVEAATAPVGLRIARSVLGP